MSPAVLATHGESEPAIRISRQAAAGLAVLALAVGMALLLARVEAVLAPLWLLGMVAGFTLQRSRFCFASAFRDLFLFGHSRVMRGILLGLGVATVGFSIVMAKEVPFARLGALPAEAHILPVGLSTVAAGRGRVRSGGDRHPHVQGPYALGPDRRAVALGQRHLHAPAPAGHLILRLSRREEPCHG